MFQIVCNNTYSEHIVIELEVRGRANTYGCEAVAQSLQRNYFFQIVYNNTYSKHVVIELEVHVRTNTY